MRKLGLLMLLVGLGVLAAFVTASAMPFKDDPAGQVFYLEDGTGLLLYQNTKGIDQNALIVVFKGTVALEQGTTGIVGGAAIAEVKNVLGNGTMWRIVFAGPATPGAYFLVHFAPVAAIGMVIIGSR